MMDIALSAIGGASAVAVVAKWAINRALGDLDKLSSAVGGIRENLAAVAVRLEDLARHAELLKEHDRKIAYFEGSAKCRTSEKR